MDPVDNDNNSGRGGKGKEEAGDGNSDDDADVDPVQQMLRSFAHGSDASPTRSSPFATPGTSAASDLMMLRQLQALMEARRGTGASQRTERAGGGDAEQLLQQLLAANAARLASGSGGAAATAGGGGAANESGTTESGGRASLMEQLMKMVGGGGGGKPTQPQQHRDGSHSDSVGPAPCGKRHWFKNREVDYVTTYQGRLMLGFNKADNPLIVARDFVAEHNLNPKSTDNTALITQIADLIRETIVSDSKHQETMDIATLVDGQKVGPYAGEEGEVIRPYGEAGGVRAVYNRATGQVDVIHYAGGDGEDEKKWKEKKQRKALDQKQQKDAALRQREQEREETLRRIQLMRADNRSSEPAPMIVPQPKSGAHHLPSAAASSSSGGSMATLRDLSEGSHGGGGAVGPNKARTSPGIASLSGLAAASPAASPPPARPEDWTEAYAMQRYRVLGMDGLLREMAASGFTEEQQSLASMKMLYLDMMMRAPQQPAAADLDLPRASMGGDEADDKHHKKARQHQPVAAFGGQGHSLGGGGAAVHEPALDVVNSNYTGGGGGGGGDAEQDGIDVASGEGESDLPEVVVDSSQPTTQVRIAVPGRSQQLIATFNLTHTVAHVRRYVAQHAGIGHGRYHLQVLRPLTRLDDLSVTIVAAKLERATINIVIHE